ncbi:MAG: response regulator transcription factor, partial [bacterium]|nr:response regulator transcription factor [bacterium]
MSLFDWIRRRGSDPTLDAEGYQDFQPLEGTEPDGAEIFVISPEPRTGRLVCEMLSDAGLAARAYRTSQGAVRGFKRVQPDIVIIDLSIPERSLTTVCKAIHDANRRVIVTSIVALVPKGEVPDPEMLDSIGADDYFVQPVKPTDLKTRISLLHKHRERLSTIESEHDVFKTEYERLQVATRTTS